MDGAGHVARIRCSGSGISDAVGWTAIGADVSLFSFVALLLFLIVHVTMISLSGFRSRMRAMMTGRVAASEEDR